MTNHPTLAADLYTDAALADPYPIFRTIRDLDPAVWLSAHNAWAIGRFDDVRAALRADDVLVSGRGVAMNDLVNGQAAQSSRVTLVSDGDVHRQLRTVLMKPMLPSALRDVQAEVEALADTLVERLAARDSRCATRTRPHRLRTPGPESQAGVVGYSCVGAPNVGAWLLFSVGGGRCSIGFRSIRRVGRRCR